MEKCLNPEEKVWREGRGIGGVEGGGNFNKKNAKMHPKINLCSKFHPNRTMRKCSKSGGNFEKQFQMASKFYQTHQILSVSDNGKVFKPGGDLRNANVTNCITK